MIENIGVFRDKEDETIKTVYDVGNNRIIEMSVLYNKQSKDVICVPSHHFCNLGCKMCHLTKNGYNKAMTPINIDDFIYCLKDTLLKYKTNKSKLLISFMGVGEPLLNLQLIENVFKREEEIKTIGYSEISYAISTMMPNDNLIKLTHLVDKYSVPMKVHFSLHSPLNGVRKELIPSSTIDIDDALNLLIKYKNKLIENKTFVTNYLKFHKEANPIEIHYTLIDNINDTDKELNELIKLLKKYPITIKFIRFNPIGNLKISNKEQKWLKILKDNLPNLKIKTYTPPGRGVGSSCGEFTKHYYHYEKETEEELTEFLKWQKEYSYK